MASPFPCPNPPSTCETNPNPATGYSSEATDSTTFISLAWNGNPPPLNKAFNLVPCEAIAESQVSQADADRLAHNAAVTCAGVCGGVFQNSAQTVSKQCSNGVDYFYTLAAGQWLADNQVLADRLAFTAASEFIAKHSLCPGTLTEANSCLNAFYFGTISVVSTDTLSSAIISQGELPPGTAITVESNRVVIQGTPSVLGNYSFTLIFTTSVGVFTAQTYIINIATISTTPGVLAQGKLATAYSVTISAFPLPGQNTIWSVSSGALPTGLAIDSASGVISGTPSATGTYNFTITATMGDIACSAQFSIKIVTVDWAAMVWTNTAVVPGGSGFATGSFVGGVFSGTGKASSGASKVEGNGNVLYTGPTASCVAVVTIRSVSGQDCGFSISQDGIGRLTENLKLLAPGTYNFPFTIVAGTNSNILFTGIVAIGDPAGLFIFTNNGSTDDFTISLQDA